MFYIYSNPPGDIRIRFSYFSDHANAWYIIPDHSAKEQLEKAVFRIVTESKSRALNAEKELQFQSIHS